MGTSSKNRAFWEPIAKKHHENAKNARDAAHQAEREANSIINQSISLGYAKEGIVWGYNWNC